MRSALLVLVANPASCGFDYSDAQALRLVSKLVKNEIDPTIQMLRVERMHCDLDFQSLRRFGILRRLISLRFILEEIVGQYHGEEEHNRAFWLLATKVAVEALNSHSSLCQLYFHLHCQFPPVAVPPHCDNLVPWRLCLGPLPGQSSKFLKFQELLDYLLVHYCRHASPI